MSSQAPNSDDIKQEQDDNAVGPVAPLASSIDKRIHQSSEDVFSDVIDSIKRARSVLSLWILLCLILAALYLWRSPQTFTSEATILLDPRRPAGLSMDQNAPNYPPALDSAQADSQIQVLKSERLLRSVFDSLSLSEDPEFNAGSPSFLSMALKIFRNSNNSAISGVKTNFDETKLQAFARKVSARRIGQSYVIEVSYTTNTAEKAARIANSITMAYLGQQIAAKAAAAQNGTEFLQGRILALQSELVAVSNAIKLGTISEAPLPDADARVIGAALAPNGRSSPQYMLVFASALVFSALSGLVTIVIMSSFDHRLRNVRQVQLLTGTHTIVKRRRVPRRRRAFMKFDPASMFIGSSASNVDEYYVYCSELLAEFISGSLKSQIGEGIGVVTYSDPECGRLISNEITSFLISQGKSSVLIPDLLAFNKKPSSYFWAMSYVSQPETNSDRPSESNFTSPVIAPPLLDLREIAELYNGQPPYLVPNVNRLVNYVDRQKTNGNVIVNFADIDQASSIKALQSSLKGVVVVLQAGSTQKKHIHILSEQLQQLRLAIIGVIFVEGM